MSVITMRRMAMHTSKMDKKATVIVNRTEDRTISMITMRKYAFEDNEKMCF